MSMKSIAVSLFILLHFNSFTQNRYNTLTPVQMKNDLDILQSAWTNLHPGLYRYNTPGQIQQYFDDLRNQCGRPKDERAFYLLLSQLAQKIKCGHTYLNPLNLDKQTRERLLNKNAVPFFFRVTAGRQIIITHNLCGNDKIIAGDEIVAINGVPAKRIIDSLLTVSRSDGRNAIGKMLNNINETPDEADAYSLFDIYFPLFFPTMSDSYVFSIKKINGLPQRFTVNLASREERMAAYEKQYGSIPVGEKTWDYKILDNGTAYMKFGTFAFWNSSFNETRYVDSIFDDLRRHASVKKLIIDIRGNEGGDNTGDYILSYLTTKKIGCDDPNRRCYRYLTIPDSLLPYLSTWDNSFKKPKDPSQYKKNELGLYESVDATADCDFIMPKSNGFRGKVCLLIDAKNSSAGYEMARNFSTAKLGKTVGEPTGGSQQGINGGEFFFLTLPNSKFETDLPLIFAYHPNKPDKGITPDHTVPTTQRDIHAHRDRQLQFALHLLSIVK